MNEEDKQRIKEIHEEWQNTVSKAVTTLVTTLDSISGENQAPLTEEDEQQMAETTVNLLEDYAVTPEIVQQINSMLQHRHITEGIREKVADMLKNNKVMNNNISKDIIKEYLTACKIVAS